MIIELFLDAIYGIFSLLTAMIELPSLPEGITEVIGLLFDYLTVGAQILGTYLPLQEFAILFGIVLAVDIGVNVYKFVMWIIRKIPMANIS